MDWVEVLGAEMRNLRCTEDSRTSRPRYFVVWYLITPQTRQAVDCAIPFHRWRKLRFSITKQFSQDDLTNNEKNWNLYLDLACDKYLLNE